jgi:hypothetical protein
MQAKCCAIPMFVFAEMPEGRLPSTCVRAANCGDPDETAREKRGRKEDLTDANITDQKAQIILALFRTLLSDGKGSKKIHPPP